MRITTLALIFNSQKDSFLMGLHQRGEGKGKLSFVGGKVADKPEFAYETPEESVQREIFEETHLKPQSIVHQADIYYYYPPIYEKDSEIMKVYRIDSFQGDEKEDPDELKLTWITINNLPHNQMWPSDRLWLPRLLEKPELFHTVEFVYDEKRKLISEKYSTLGLPKKVL